MIYDARNLGTISTLVVFIGTCHFPGYVYSEYFDLNSFGILVSMRKIYYLQTKSAIGIDIEIQIMLSFDNGRFPKGGGA